MKKLKQLARKLVLGVVIVIASGSFAVLVAIGYRHRPVIDCDLETRELTCEVRWED